MLCLTSLDSSVLRWYPCNSPGVGHWGTDNRRKDARELHLWSTCEFCPGQCIVVDLLKRGAPVEELTLGSTMLESDKDFLGNLCQCGNL